MFLNPWYSGQQQQQQQQQQPPQPLPASQDVSSHTTTVLTSNPENGVINDLQNIHHVVGGSNGSGSLSSGLSPAPSPRLPPRSLDNKNQQIEELQRTLRSGWTVHMSGDGRFYYCK